MSGNCRSVRDSRPASIDDFLEANVDFRDIGRICITAALTVFGPRIAEPVRGESQDWLEYLWWRLHIDAPISNAFVANQLKVVSFNYDTSFEQYFATTLGAYYPDLRKDKSKVTAFRDEVLPIVHIHGSLGPASVEVRSLENPHDRNLITWYQQAARGIRILNEGEHTAEYSIAHEWIREADVIYILGFGYHRTNTHRLDLGRQLLTTEASHPDRIVRGTALGVGEFERSEVTTRLNLGRAVMERANGLLFESDARAFLERHGLA